MAKTMLFRTIPSEGVAHRSYVFAHKGTAAVVDPRRDIDVYLELARENEVRIEHIFETHRNEDYVIGSRDLARITGATIHHGPNLEWGYGEVVHQDDTFHIGQWELRVLETPGHTFDSISLVVYDRSFGEDPLAVCTGDALFIGDVGRTDFYPDRAEEVAGLLYDSIFEKLLPLGDQVVLLPAHGAGSVCGGGLAPRDVSTLGYERKNNPALHVEDREEFIRNKTSEDHYKPPYFSQMEQYNQHGPPPMDRLPEAPALSAGAFAEALDGGARIVDVREPEAFAGAFIPGSLALPKDLLGAYAGWFRDYDSPILLVGEDDSDIRHAVRELFRIGYDDIAGFLAGGMSAWETTGRPYDRIPALHVEDLSEPGPAGEDPILLDVRKDDEFRGEHLSDAQHIYLGYLPEKLDDLPGKKPIVTFCGSGRRALTAASILKAHEFTKVYDNLGSMAACKAAECKTVSG